ncbi:polyphosphate kinase 2 [Agrobacterium salinitolerans]|uniref:ADP/GDP-polyphosphate phosphotransferase n=1 Tax=Agrobacterium salinitolerans TaxID=1183413 RepID=A0ABY3BQZ1_9HYPH|nr:MULTISPECIES: polyphosphate kinase 2 [Agrobacterium]MCZ7850725.1 polyphosphate kinase 2 [Agrobacterium salinitolerans]MCZ7856415.1 polyphosphate kinase 2 [Agrobacterium salinitolerans]MCZ7890930.1 polyphosphate kinase 2 [Agrobacterium salinitolerans]MCZ7973864.1 polyphosphate kinase 2 [Agrobacterium salinitolerans]TRA93140.1 polyphosphate kinase 2 [Agrobacterium salinitolerans]
MGEETKKRTVDITVDGKLRSFDIDDPVLPDWVEEKKLSAGNFPYDKKMKREDYDTTLEALQVELVKVQFWLQTTGKRVMAVFEGRDAAGKGGAIFAARAYLNPRYARVVALTKPTETERGQWYFQRYISHFPTAGEFVLFDRSWYNRAGVEPVMGFCTPEEHKRFLKETPRLEKMLVHDDVHLFKFWLDIGRETQIERFHDRRHSPLKCWKLSDMDIAALTKWDDYTQKRDEMLANTHTDDAPWTVVRANDKRRARVNLIRHILLALDYEGKDKKAIGEIDNKIVGSGPDFIK